MTKEEAITYLEDAKSYLPYKFEQALDMAIEALQNLSKPNNGFQGSDLIRRQDAIDELKTFIVDETTQSADQIWNGAIKTAMGCMRRVPTQAEPKTGKWKKTKYGYTWIENNVCLNFVDYYDAKEDGDT